MAKPLVFEFGGREIPLQLNKVDRSKLYGFKELEVLDDKKRECELATLSGDGQTVVGRGGTALAYLSTDGLWCDKGELRPIDLEGNQITPVGSSFNAPIPLTEEVSIDEFMDHDIRIVYRMEPEDSFDDELLAKLQSGAIYRFGFSYRGGVDPDAAFLLVGEDGNVFMLVGTRVQLEFVGLQQAAPAVEEEVEEDDADAMDFDMI